MSNLNANSEKKQVKEEQRKYIRLNAVFPVEFQFLDVETGGSISDIKQAFTRDISKGGICLQVNNIEEGFEEILKKREARLDLRLNIPLDITPKKAIANISWYKKIKAGYPNKYLIGVSFLQIDPKDRNSIYYYARIISLAPKAIGVVILSLFLGVGYFYFAHIKLTKENTRLVDNLVKLSGEKSGLEKSMIEFNDESQDIEKKLSANQAKMEKYKTEIKKYKSIALKLDREKEILGHFQQDKFETKEKLKAAVFEKKKLSKKADTLSKEAEHLKARFSKLSEANVLAADNLNAILPSFEKVEVKSMQNMYKWIRSHQNRFTGLVVSYEGDKNLEDWAFTYDQSLSSQVFTLMGDQSNAQMIFDFYKDKAVKKDSGFLNAYDAYTGMPVEYNVHAGPNIWMGIAILQYTERFKDEQYLYLAEMIGEWLIGLQNEDSEYGLRGGPKTAWFSTEHNLDGYAFFGMLYKITNEEKYLEAQDRIFKWIKKYAFNNRQGRLNRGKGDATIATDTFAWAIAAIGPKLLKASNMDPDQIMDFAEKNCLVTAYYKRPNGDRINITGFDFGKYEHMARGGIVSTEWTAQMVVSFRIMAEYHSSENELLKADYCRRKADFYLSELEKMVIASPSKIGRGEGCLPYATQEDVDTGHGWSVAHGATTGSTAGTAYTIFAKYNYNPLMFKLK